MHLPISAQPHLPLRLGHFFGGHATTTTVACSNTAAVTASPEGSWALSTWRPYLLFRDPRSSSARVQPENTAINMPPPPRASGPRYSVKHQDTGSGFPKRWPAWSRVQPGRLEELKALQVNSEFGAMRDGMWEIISRWICLPSSLRDCSNR